MLCHPHQADGVLKETQTTSLCKHCNPTLRPQQHCRTVLAGDLGSVQFHGTMNQFYACLQMLDTAQGATSDSCES